MYKRDFGLCLRDYYLLTGYPAMIPRYALGIWWYRDRIYSFEDIKKLENKLSFDGRIIINFKGSKKLDTPTCIDDLKLKEEPGDVDVYATEGLSVSDAFTTKAFNALKRIEIKDNLVNINIVVWGGHTAIYLSYDDPVVNLPFDKAFCGSPIEQYKKNLLEIMAIMAEN